jgi:hypothetical protein
MLQPQTRRFCIRSVEWVQFKFSHAHDYSSEFVFAAWNVIRSIAFSRRRTFGVSKQPCKYREMLCYDYRRLSWNFFLNLRSPFGITMKPFQFLMATYCLAQVAGSTSYLRDSQKQFKTIWVHQSAKIVLVPGARFTRLWSSGMLTIILAMPSISVLENVFDLLH